MKYILLISLTLFIGTPVMAQFAGGSGSDADPYQIEDLEQLQAIQNFVDLHFILIADIDASDTQNWNEGSGFEPIGIFTGTFDGAGHIIEHLTINRPDQNDVGLFGRSDGSVITNLGVVNAQITGGEYTAAIVGRHLSSEIHNSFSSGVISGADRVGGLVGDNRHGEALIVDSYSTASVSGDRRVGGLIGYNRDGAGLASSYATGEVSGDRDVGGLIGQNTELLSSVYWDVETSGQTVAVGSGTEAGASGLATDQMTAAAAQDNMQGFDFEETWILNAGYPALHWEDVEPLPSTSIDQNEIPLAIELRQNFPNPFNPVTVIQFVLPESQHVQLEVYNVMGQRVAILLDESRASGVHSVNFNSNQLASGVYLYRLNAGDFTQTKQMMLLK